jgi:hypothetical protein
VHEKKETMAASASLSIPLTLATTAQALDARKILESTAGLTDVALDAAGGKATVRYQFPGNIDHVMSRLRSRRLVKSSTIAMSVPVKNHSGRTVDPAEVVAHLNASPAVTNASFDGTTVSATVVAATNALRFVYEELLIAGLMPVDRPTVAGPQEFVL